ncbi:MAG: hypothetical protein J6Q32_02070, partial [Clostridia bacterium]|nr:hypothetical protein [Clostridia bacterium]
TNKSFGIEVAKLAGVKQEITDRAKDILKSLEKSEKSRISYENTEVILESSETERIIKELDVNNLSPMQALAILADLKEKITN